MIKKKKQKNKNHEENKEKIYFIATDPEKRPITLKEKTWKHIKKQHPEIIRPTRIKNTINKPDFILENTRKSLIYSVKTDLALYFNVIARVEGEYPYIEGGNVSTAYYTPKIVEGVSIWTR